MSHGGQELFHSDFLQWLAIHEPKFFKAVMTEVKLPADYKRVKREWKHFDLAFFDTEDDKAEPTLVIENKFKSLPHQDQVDGYKDICGEAKFYFLSLFDPGNLSTPLITYSQLVDAMEKSIDLIDASTDEGCFRRNLVERYIGFVRSLLAFIGPISYMNAKDEEIEAVPVKDYFCRPGYDDGGYKQAIDLRLDSLVKNIRMSRLRAMLSRRLENAGIKIDDKKVDLCSGISSSKCLVECWLNIGEPVNEGAKSKPKYECRYFMQFDDGRLNPGIQVNNELGASIAYANKAEKAEKKLELAKSLVDMEALDSIHELASTLVPENDDSTVHAFNNMIYKCLKDYTKEGTVGQALEVMTEDIIKNYEKLNNNNK